MTTQAQPRTDGDTYTPAVQLGQGDYIYEWPPRPTAQPATIDIDVRPGISDGVFSFMCGTMYGILFSAAVVAVYHWST